jgi:multicomponent Na+:H+ antiporter subunit E
MIWFLLTADFSLANIVIGLAAVFLLPNSKGGKATLGDWLITIWHIITAIPKAYYEAFEMILFPHLDEEVTVEKVKVKPTPGLIFLDIFLITFTPKTIVLNYREDGYYDVHWVKRK